MYARAIIILAAMLLLAGCAHKGPGSVLGGECKIFEAPSFEVRGQRPYDQDWIDSNIEGGVGGCGWPRPAARPPELEAPAAANKPVAVPAKPRKLLGRVKDGARRTWRHHAAPALQPAPVMPAPVTPAPAVAAEPAAVEPVAQPPRPPPAPPVRPRSAIEELLHLPGERS